MDIHLYRRDYSEVGWMLSGRYFHCLIIICCLKSNCRRRNARTTPTTANHMIVLFLQYIPILYWEWHLLLSSSVRTEIGRKTSSHLNIKRQYNPTIIIVIHGFVNSSTMCIMFNRSWACQRKCKHSSSEPNGCNCWMDNMSIRACLLRTIFCLYYIVLSSRNCLVLSKIIFKPTTISVFKLNSIANRGALQC